MEMGVGWDHCEFHEDAFCLIDNTCAPSSEYKWYQPPVRAFPDNVFYGWNEFSVCCNAMVADDWYCDTEDAVVAIRWWGSHRRWTDTSPPPNRPDHFHITFWTDVPAGVDEPFSHPGVVIHEVYADVNTWEFVGWDYDPRMGEYESAFRYDYTFSPAEYFHQQPGGNIYWVSIAACYGGVEPGPNPWGWKSVPRNPNSPAPDDAVTMPNPGMICPVPGTNWEQMGGGAPIYWPTPEDSWDMAFELVGRAAAQEIKWRQPPDLEWPGLHAHDSGSGVDYQTITLADQFECQGGQIHDLHWYGNYEMLGGVEMRGSGIMSFHLSLHANAPGIPWCLPGVTLWSTDIPFATAMETDTGLVNNEGSPIYRYSYVLPDPYPQEPGLIYWFDIAAMSVNPVDPPWWRWQEAGRNPAPILCPAAVQYGPIPSPWWSIEWPTIPPTYTDLAFEVTSIFYGELTVKWSQPPQPFVPPDAFYGWDDYSVYGSNRQIDADDWLCQQETPVSDVHWWGSYIGWSSPEPPMPLPDSFHLGIWTDEPAGPAFSHPRNMIWDYWCSDYTWEFAGWDFDPRDPEAAPEACFKFECILPRDEWFFQGPRDTIYWLSVSANYMLAQPDCPFGWKTRPRAPSSPAPDDAVRIFDPTAPALGDPYVDGEPIWWPNPEDSWDLAFALTTPECPIADPPVTPLGEPGYTKMRNISMVPGNPGRLTALRVTLTNLPEYSEFNGTQCWVGPPGTYCENAGVVTPPCPPATPTIDYVSARLEGTPHCMDWSTVGAVHVTDDEIVPPAVYDVQAIDCDCDFGNEAYYSAPLTIVTSRYGDLVGHCMVTPCTPPDGTVGIPSDVTACLDKFKNLAGAVMKSRADVDWEVPNRRIDISDVTFVLDAFRGCTYSRTPPFPFCYIWRAPDGCP